MYAIEFRDEEYNELIEDAQTLVEEAHKMKKRACKLIKKLSEQPMDEEDDDEEMETEYRHYQDSMPMYKRSSGYRPSYRRMR